MTAIVAVTLGAMTVAGAQPGAQQRTTAGRSLTQQSCFQSGSGATFFRPCVSIHGNVFSLQAPSGFEHINVGTDVEGYGICSSLGYVYDAGFQEAGFGSQTITQPGGANTLPLTIARTGGGFRVTQTYARDTVQREFNITMAVKNVTASAITGVKIARFFDGDTDNNTFTTAYDSSLDGVWGRNVRSVALQSVSLATSHTVAIETFTELTSNLAGGVCNIPTTAGPVSGDYAGVAYYSFSSIAAGATKTVKFTYRVM
jgi:hypothetical protein